MCWHDGNQRACDSQTFVMLHNVCIQVQTFLIMILFLPPPFSLSCTCTCMYSQVKRHKASNNSTLNSNNNFAIDHVTSSPPAPIVNIPNEILDTSNPAPTNRAKLDRALLHTHLLPRSLPKRRRRSSVAIMNSTLAVPHTIIPLESVDFNVTDPSLADMNRKRRTSWSYIVGSSDSRSIDTGLNELDRITGN